MLQQKQILEYEWVGKGRAVSLTDAQLKRFEKLAENLPGNAVEWGRNRFRFCGYCGVIQLGNLTLEVLPKIHEKEVQPGISRKLLVRMLIAVRELGLYSTGMAELNLQKYDLLDIFILDFAEKLQALLRKGMLQTYIRREENISFVRGKISISQHINNNLCRLDRIFCLYYEFLCDNLQNRIIKATLVFISRFARSNRVKQILEQLCGIFAEISDYFPVESDWNSLAYNRQNEDWREILEQCRLFLQGMNPDIISGNDNSISFIFAMNKLFEKYVAIELKTSISDNYDVFIERPRKNLLNKSDGTELFFLKPDIYVKPKTPDRAPAILDTKWKLLNDEEKKMGIAQSDLYQMYTYAGIYKVNQVILLYPRQQNLKNQTHYSFTDGKQKSLDIVPIDLEILINGRQSFRNYLSEIIIRTLKT